MSRVEGDSSDGVGGRLQGDDGGGRLRLGINSRFHKFITFLMSTVSGRQLFKRI